MSTETRTPAEKTTPAPLRLLVFVASAAAALFWLYVARASVAEALPLAKDVRLGLHVTVVFLLLVWPALILTIANFWLWIAAGLTTIAATFYGYVFVTYLPALPPSAMMTLSAVLLCLVMLGASGSTRSRVLRPYRRSSA